MKIKNNLTSIKFSELTTERDFYLGDYIPTGVLDVKHVFYRYKEPTRYWSDWRNPSFNITTLIASTPGLPPTVNAIEFKRVTPPFSLYRDPKQTGSRLSELDLKSNANQGVFVAVEAAAKCGINAYDKRLPDVGAGSNELNIQQMTQNYYDATTDFSDKLWDFSFVGGYLDVSHIYAMVRRKDTQEWLLLNIDTTPSTPDTPNINPFRLHQQFTLYMDFTALSYDIDGLVIYRHTPRDVLVQYPKNGVRVTSANLKAITNHALFVAMELGEQISKRVDVYDHTQYYASSLYPVEGELGDFVHKGDTTIEATGYRGLYEDAMTMSYIDVSGRLKDTLINLDVSDAMTVSVTTISAELKETSTVYTNQREVGYDKISKSTTTITGTLGQSRIIYDKEKTYFDAINKSLTTLSGSLVTIVVTYSNEKTYFDAINKSLTSLAGSSLVVVRKSPEIVVDALTKSTTTVTAVYQ